MTKSIITKIINIYNRYYMNSYLMLIYYYKKLNKNNIHLNFNPQKHVANN